jgi:hypothetical protein
MSRGTRSGLAGLGVNMDRNARYLLWLVAAKSGCSQATPEVHGQVTLDGAVVADAQIQFISSDEKLRPSFVGGDSRWLPCRGFALLFCLKKCHRKPYGVTTASSAAIKTDNTAFACPGGIFLCASWPRKGPPHHPASRI